MKKLIFLIIVVCLTVVVSIYGFQKFRSDSKSNTNEALEEEYESLEKELDELNEELEDTKASIEAHNAGEVPDPDGLFNELDMFQVTADTYEIDYRIPYAISKYETSNFNSNLYLNQNNPAHLMDGDEYSTFSSKQKGIDYFVKYIKENYLDKGLDTIEKIQPEFRPDNKNWTEKVQAIYDTL